MSPVQKAKAVDVIDHSLETAQIMDRKGYPYVIHPLTDGVPRCDPRLLQAWVAWASAQPEVKSATLLVAPEAMGLPLVAPLAIATGLPYVVIRKRKYDMPGEEVAYCETGYGEACLHINDVWPDDNVLIIDDVVSTGGTLGAILATLKNMAVPVAGALVFLDKGGKTRKLSADHNVPIRVMRRVVVDQGKVRVLPTEK
jgi:adenine phosphoribosyltransferase